MDAAAGKKINNMKFLWNFLGTIKNPEIRAILTNAVVENEELKKKNAKLAEQVPQWKNPKNFKPKDENKCVLVIVDGSATGKDGIYCTFFDAFELAFYINKKWFLKNFEYSDKVRIKRWMDLPKNDKNIKK